MTDNNIKFVVVGRPSDQTILGAEAPYAIKKTIKQEYIDNAQELINTLGQSSPYPELRDEAETIYGTWYTYCDHNVLSYSVLTNNSYKKNVAYDLLKEVCKVVYEETAGLQSGHASMEQVPIKDIVQNVCEKYQNERNVDKISMAQSKVKEVTNVMQDNVKNMVRNIHDAEELEDQSNNIKGNAEQFRKHAKGVENAMKARNRRLNILIICIILAVLLYIIVPIIVWASKD